MAQPAPDNWRGAMVSTRAEGPTSRATSQPRNQERKPATKGVTGRSTTRSSSQPKQRGKAGAGKLPPVPPALSVHEARLAKQRKECEGKATEELETQLQTLLQRGSFGDAAYLIEASEFLAAKYKTADVVRLMLETKQFERATQLIREMNMTSNQLLVTLLVKDLVLASQFHAAVRVAQEMVQDFGKSAAEAAGAEQGRVGWTPLALVQAMIRAQHFRTALKFAKQFNLLETFPVVPLVASMFETRAWADGVSSVMEYRLFAEFPLNVLTVRMLEQRQWALAVKCMNKLDSKEELGKFQQALVQEAARVGDFVTSIMYLREFKLDQPDTYQALLRFIVDAMIGHGEFYKAIKYAIKFELAGDESSDLQSKYGTKALIMRALQSGQYHVATTYIKKLKLRDDFAQELIEIEKLQQARLVEFRQYMQLRMAQYEDPGYQMQLHRLIGEKAIADAELIVLDPVDVDVVISETEEFFPRKKKASVNTDEESGLMDTSTPQVPIEGAEAPSEGVEEALDQLQVSDSSPQRQSRFKFAQATSSTGDQSAVTHPTDPDERQPNVVESPLPPSSRPPNPPGFNFAEFASSVQQMAPRSIQPPGFHTPSTQPPGFEPSVIPPPAVSPTSSLHRSGLQSHSASQSTFQLPPPPQGFRPVLQPPPGVLPMHSAYSNPAMRGQMPPPTGGMGFPQGPSPASGAGYTASFQPPLPPQPSQAMHMQAPPYPMGPGNSTVNSTLGSGGSGGFDIASLAMQFHSSGSAPGFSGGFGSAPPPPPAPPAGFANSPIRPYQPVGGYPGAPHLSPAFGFMPPPPPPPTSTFKPSVSYTTSVITTRQKK